MNNKLLEEKISKKFKYQFNTTYCDKLYFEDLKKLLNQIDPMQEKYKRMTKKKISSLNMKCKYNYIKNCKRDEFFFEKKTQIIIGRFFDSAGCFYNCKQNYFAMAMDPYSVIKNDIFIRYMINKSSIFIKNIDNKLETIFPIRILLSKSNLITRHQLKDLIEINDYYTQSDYKTKKKKRGVSKYNLNIFLNSNNLTSKKITENIPINHIVGRELCLMYYLNYYFYIVEDDKKQILPFILVSKFNLEVIKNTYNNILKKKMPNIKLLYSFRNIKKINETPINNLCIKYDYLIIQNNFNQAKQMVYENIQQLNYKKFNNTINFLWNYVGYFIIVTSDKDQNIKSYFFQNKTSDRTEIKIIREKIKKYYGKEYIKILNENVPEEKVKSLKKLYRLLGKEYDSSISLKYNQINLNKIYDLVIMNNIIWQWGHSYQSSDYYTSNYINLFRNTIQKGKIKNKIFFINYFDRPVLHNKYKYYLFNTFNKHNKEDYMEIYSPTTNNNFQDIPIPTPDLWSMVTKIHFGDSCSNNYQDSPVKIPYQKKINKLFFRGSNTSLYPNDIEKNHRLYFLNLINNNKSKFEKNFFDVGITNLPKSNILNECGEIIYSDIDKIKEKFPEFEIFPFYPMSEQSKYKYILDMDGIASAWRLPYYFSFNSTIFKQEGEFKEYYYNYSEFKNSVIFFNKENLIDKIESTIKGKINSKEIARNSYLFFKKHFNKNAVLNYMVSITSQKK